MEDDGLCLDFPVLDVYLVSAQHDGDVLAHTDQVPVPVGYVLVRDSSRDVKHDNCTLSLDVVTVSETSELLLTRSVPDVEPDRPPVCVEHQRMYLHTQGSCN